MKTTLLFLLVPVISFCQKPDLSIFDNLTGKTWKTEAEWGNGSKFKQEIDIEYSLDSTIIITNTRGFTDDKQSEFGLRNHGVRMYDAASKQIKFWEFDIFGGITEGTVYGQGKNIVYQYEYGGMRLTEMWEYVDENTYNYTIGVYAGDTWTEKYLASVFKAN